MSWSVSACGPAAKVAVQLEQQFDHIKLTDAGEQETATNAKTLVLQTVATIDSERPIRVTASGLMGFKEWNTKQSPYQSVDIKIEPIHFTT